MSANAPRRFRRRFWMCMPAVVLLAAAGVALLFLTMASVLARGDFDAGQYRDAAAGYSAQRTLTRYWPEPWKATFNEGTANLANDDYFAARGTLEIALGQVPPAPPAPDGPDGALDPNSYECMVRTNLSLSIEGQAVEARAAKNKAEAIAFFNEALDVIGPCTSDGESESDEEDSDDQDESDSDSSEDQIEDRQSQQRDETRQEQESEGQGEGQGGGSGENSSGEGDSEGEQGQSPNGGGGGNQQEQDDPRIGELQDRNNEAAEHGPEIGGGGGFGGGQNW